jgi:hypothetical protein
MAKISFATSIKEGISLRIKIPFFSLKILISLSAGVYTALICCPEQAQKKRLNKKILR